MNKKLFLLIFLFYKVKYCITKVVKKTIIKNNNNNKKSDNSNPTILQTKEDIKKLKEINKLEKYTFENTGPIININNIQWNPDITEEEKQQYNNILQQIQLPSENDLNEICNILQSDIIKILNKQLSWRYPIENVQEELPKYLNKNFYNFFEHIEENNDYDTILYLIIQSKKKENSCYQYALQFTGPPRMSRYYEAPLLIITIIKNNQIFFEIQEDSRFGYSISYFINDKIQLNIGLSGEGIISIDLHEYNKSSSSEKQSLLLIKENNNQWCVYRSYDKKALTKLFPLELKIKQEKSFKIIIDFLIYLHKKHVIEQYSFKNNSEIDYYHMEHIQQIPIFKKIKFFNDHDEQKYQKKIENIMIYNGYQLKKLYKILNNPVMNLANNALINRDTLENIYKNLNRNILYFNSELTNNNIKEYSFIDFQLNIKLKSSELYSYVFYFFRENNKNLDNESVLDSATVIKSDCDNGFGFFNIFCEVSENNIVSYGLRISHDVFNYLLISASDDGTRKIQWVEEQENINNIIYFKQSDEEEIDQFQEKNNNELEDDDNDDSEKEFNKFLTIDNKHKWHLYTANDNKTISHNVMFNLDIKQKKYLNKIFDKLLELSQKKKAIIMEEKSKLLSKSSKITPK